MNKRKLLRTNPVIEAIRAKRPTFGCYVAVPSPTIIELAGLAGFEWIRIDWSHSPLDLPIIENMVRAAECHNVAPFMRVDYDPQKIALALEAGIMGVIVPDIETPEDAEAVVNAVKFSPMGKRGMFSSPRKLGYGTVDVASFKKWSNEEVMVGIQIENLEAVNKLEQILEIEGIDMILSGRGDLSNALGVPG